MLCPKKFKVLRGYNGKVYATWEHDKLKCNCEEEECAWWVDIKNLNITNKNHPNCGKEISGCSLKIIAQEKLKERF